MIQPAEKKELVEALRRLYQLPMSYQLDAYRALRDYLGSDAPQLVKADQEVQARVAALAAMRLVAAHLRLADGVAPAATEFQSAAGEAAPGWNTTRVIASAPISSRGNGELICSSSWRLTSSQISRYPRDCVWTQSGESEE